METTREPRWFSLGYRCARGFPANKPTASSTSPLLNRKMESTLDATVAVSVPSPAQQATDDVLLLVFSSLAECFCAPDAPHKLAAARFTWFRTTLPLVCTRWHRLVLHTPALWSAAIISPAAEAHAARRSIRQQQLAQGDAHAAPAAAAAAGASPLRQRPGFFLDASESSTPVRGGSPVLGSSPDSDLGGYWSSHFAPLPGVSAAAAGSGRGFLVPQLMLGACAKVQ